MKCSLFIIILQKYLFGLKNMQQMNLFDIFYHLQRIKNLFQIQFVQYDEIFFLQLVIKSDLYPLHQKNLTLDTHFTLTLMKVNFGAVRSESSPLPFYNAITDIRHFTIRLNNFITQILQSIIKNRIFSSFLFKYIQSIPYN